MFCSSIEIDCNNYDIALFQDCLQSGFSIVQCVEPWERVNFCVLISDDPAPEAVQTFGCFTGDGAGSQKTNGQAA